MKTKSTPAPAPQLLKRLLAEARKAAKHSYSPYSHFSVGSALLLSNGQTVTGTNVENISYGLTICAERSALAAAVSRFGPKIRIQAIAVANLNRAVCSPCGACRQMLAEFASPQAQVIFQSTDGIRTMTISELLPMAFDIEP